MPENIPATSRLKELENYAESLNILSEMGRKYNMTSNRDEVFSITAKYTGKIISSVKRTSIVLLDNTGKNFLVYALEGNSVIPNHTKFPLQNTAIEKAIKHIKLTKSDNVAGSCLEDYKLLAKAKLNNAMHAPLVDRGTAFGVINIASDTPFTWRDEQLLTKISAFLSSTLSSRILFDELQKAMFNTRQSIYYAKKIQTALLPEAGELNDFFKDYFLIDHPKDIVSGDFYWIKKQGSKLFLVVGDCTGHGISGAMMTVLGINLLGELTGNTGLESPSEIINEMDLKLKTLLKQGNNLAKFSVQDGIDMSLCLIDLETKTLTYTGARRPLLILNENGLKEIKGDRYPVGGGMHRKKIFTEHKIQISSNDLFYVYSDGIVDQLGGTDMLRYGSKKFKVSISKFHNSTLSEQKRIMEKNLIEWKGNEKQTDDIIALGFKLKL